ncbi:MAG TPA: hypothetical protein VIK81_04815 [Patescibacteria group bacterium]
MSAKIKLAVLVVVVIIAGVLVVLFKDRITSLLKNQNSQNKQETQQVVDTKPTWFSGLTGQEQSLFVTPKQDSTQQELDDYSELAYSLAKAGPEIVIGTNCQPSPLALLVGPNLVSIKVTNNDTIDRTITLSPTKKYVVKKGEFTKIDITDLGASRILGYNCDNVKPSGFLVIKPE